MEGSIADLQSFCSLVNFGAVDLSREEETFRGELNRKGIPWAPSFIMKCSNSEKNQRLSLKPRCFTLKDAKYKANKEKAAQAVPCSCYAQLFNSTGLCMFVDFLGASKLNFFEWLNAATGWEKTPEEYMEIGKRIQTLRQVLGIC